MDINLNFIYRGEMESINEKVFIHTHKLYRMRFEDVHAHIAKTKILPLNNL